MTSARKTQAVTLVVLAIALAIALIRRPQPKPPAGPAETVYGAIQAARTGDVPGYLACYAGGMRASLDQSVKESGAPAFARYLRDTNSAIRGVAVGDPQTTADREATLRVEFIYQDRNEVQTMRLERLDTLWKITSVESAARIKTLVPYGTPVK
jgi:hypothetical protein